MQFLPVLLFMVILNLPYGTGKTLHESEGDQSTLPRGAGKSLHESEDDQSTLPHGAGKTLHESEDDQSTLPKDGQSSPNSNNLSEEDMEVKGKSPNLSEDDISADPGFNMGGVLKSIKNVINRKRWSEKNFKRLLKKLGLFKVRDLKLIRAGQKLLRKLQNNKNHIIDVYKPNNSTGGCKSIPQDEPTKQKRHNNKQPDKRAGLIDLCHETYSMTYVLAHPSGLAYKIPNAHCPKAHCYSSLLRQNIGRCIRKIKAIVVYVIDNSFQFNPKSIETGCACECHHFSFIG